MSKPHYLNNRWDLKPESGLPARLFGTFTSTGNAKPMGLSTQIPLRPARISEFGSGIPKSAFRNHWIVFRYCTNFLKSYVPAVGFQASSSRVRSTTKNSATLLRGVNLGADLDNVGIIDGVRLVAAA